MVTIVNVGQSNKDIIERLIFLRNESEKLLKSRRVRSFQKAEIFSLPEEIFFKIVNLLSKNDLNTLSCTCRDFHVLLFPQLQSKLHILPLKVLSLLMTFLTVKDLHHISWTCKKLRMVALLRLSSRYRKKAQRKAPKEYAIVSRLFYKKCYWMYYEAIVKHVERQDEIEKGKRSLSKLIEALPLKIGATIFNVAMPTGKMGPFKPMDKETLDLLIGF